MRAPVEEPVTVADDTPLGDTRTTHPAYAQIGASRVSGHTTLYDSDFHHQAYMVVRICRSQLMRGLNRDWHFGREELIEVALSEAQWATFVSAPNVGSGVPCTLKHINGVQVPQLPEPKARADQFGKEVQQTLNESLADLDGLLARIDDMGLPKGKASTIKDSIRTARSRLSGTLPFVAKQFDEHMEGTVERAKAEVHGYMTGTLMRAGLSTLSEDQPLRLEGPEGEQ